MPVGLPERQGRVRPVTQICELAGALAGCLLRDKRGLTACATDGALDLALVDGSVICTLGSAGTDWRLHARFDPGRGGFADLVLGQGNVGERVDRTEITGEQTVIQDRGYARVRDFAAVLAAKADFITRIGWRSLRLLDAERKALDVMALLPPDDQPSEHLVWVKGLTTSLRLIIQRIPPDKAVRQQKRVARKASKAGHEMDPRTPVAAGYLMLVTSLPAPAQPPERVLSMYRHRWQIELGFRRLKSIDGIDALPVFDPELARTWLLAHPIAAVLTDEIAIEIVGFPPQQPDRPRRQISIWRAWIAAHRLIIRAILPAPKRRTAKALARFRRHLSEPPRQRKIQANQLRTR